MISKDESPEELKRNITSCSCTRAYRPLLSTAQRGEKDNERRKELEKNWTSQNLRQLRLILLSCWYLGLNWIVPANELISSKTNRRMGNGMKRLKRFLSMAKAFTVKHSLYNGWYVEFSNEDYVQFRIPCNTFFTVNRRLLRWRRLSIPREIAWKYNNEQMKRRGVTAVRKINSRGCLIVNQSIENASIRGVLKIQ